MRIATYNINDINKRFDVLTTWLEAARPDVVCLQELKAIQDAFPETALQNLGYRAVWQGQKRWNGVAILTRGKSAPVVTRKTLPGDSADTQARYIEAAVNGVLVGCLYAPNGNPRPGPKYDYKLDWTRRLLAHAQSLLAADIPVVLAGDFNIVPEERDIYPTTSWDEDALVQPEVRALYAEFLGQGWTDSLRTLYPDEEQLYTFWSYRGRASPSSRRSHGRTGKPGTTFPDHAPSQRWLRNQGLRLDHVLLSPALAPQLIRGGIDRQMRGVENASDHCPVWVEV